jgi:hypothetical protein
MKGSHIPCPQVQLLWDRIVLYRQICHAPDRHSFEDRFRCSRAEHARPSGLVPEASVRNFLNPKAVSDVGLCRLCHLAESRLHVDLADSVAPVQGLPPPASPAAVIGVPDAAYLRNVAARLVETSWCAPRIRRHHFRCADSVAPVQGLPPPASPAAVIGVPDAAYLRNVAARLAETSWCAPRIRRHHFRCADRYLHEIGAGFVLARQLRFEEVAAAVLSPTDRCG